MTKATKGGIAILVALVTVIIVLALREPEGDRVTEVEVSGRARVSAESHDATPSALPDETPEQAEARFAAIRSASAEVMPPQLDGIELGMTVGELRQSRRGLRPHAQQEDPERTFLKETLENGAEVIYGVANLERRLEQIQVLSQLPGTDAIATHLAAMRDRYGTPTGIWDCPDTGGAPTRRFTWRKEELGIADIFLIHPHGISLTLYIAPHATIGASLQRSSCSPIERDALGTFPVATPEQLDEGTPTSP